MNGQRATNNSEVRIPPLDAAPLPAAAAGLGAAGHARALTARLVALRALALPALLALALATDGVDRLALLALALVGAAEIAITGRWWMRRAARGESAAAAWPPLAIGLTLDVTLMTLATAASGGPDSDLLLILTALPLVGGLVLRPTLLAAFVALGLGGRLALGGSVEQLLPVLVVGAWATAIGITTSFGGVAVRRRLEQLEAKTAAVLARDPGGSVRARVADGLRATVLEPVAAVSAELAHRPSPAVLAVLARRLETTVRRTRSTVRELHLGTAREPVPTEPLRPAPRGVAATVPALLTSRFRELAPTLIVLRLGLVVVLVATATVIGGSEPGFVPVAAVLALVQLVASWRLRRARSGIEHLATTAVDVPLVLACFVLSGDAHTTIATVMVVLIAACGFVYQPPVVAAATVLAVATGLAVDAGVELPIALAWAGVAGIVESRARARIGDPIARAVRRRARILEGIVEADDQERRRLAGTLHDGALQALIVAQQELLEAAAGSGEARGHAAAALSEARGLLAEAIGEIQVDEGAAAVDVGLAAALERATTRPRGPRAVIAVDPAAEGHDDALLVLVAREAYTNAARHARAGQVQVIVSRLPAGIALDVIDDGVGFDHERVRDALDRGHIGLATLAERVTRVGGTVDLRDAEQGGGHVRVVLPASPLRMAVDEPGREGLVGGR
ncbi:ATP-binding protein [Patulibacter defluvii]|uniref:ATP-binding protein n=1 Tax=Patulibacter defluvii TaxID=3095358 RepID=UPI002A763E4E|nr:ATP-binding protein [Patulibacter sp. DM4]